MESYCRANKRGFKKEKIQKFLNLFFLLMVLTQKVIDKIDLYQKHILANVECAKKELIYQDINFKKIHVAYQSRLRSYGVS